jgi:membrane protease YdiL (CAAX protease family)
MSFPLPNPQFDMEEPPAPQNPWRMTDIVVFGVFFLFTVFLLNVIVIRFRGRELTAMAQVFLQAIMDGMLVGFIAFLIKVIHRQPFLQTIHWFRNYQFSNGFLISLGATLAISVLIVSSFFPAGQATPIEKLLSSPTAVYVFALFGVCAAPLFEEIIFRGFLFKVLFDIKGAGTAVSVTAILFASLHVLQLWGNWAGVALIFLVGYVLSFVRWRSNSLIPSYIIHTSYNAMLFGVFALSTFIQKGVK